MFLKFHDSYKMRTNAALENIIFALTLTHIYEYTNAQAFDLPFSVQKENNNPRIYLRDKGT